MPARNARPLRLFPISPREETHIFSPGDLRVYAVLDPRRCLGRPLGAMAAAAASGGATLLQLRIKQATTRDLVAAAREVRSALAGTGVPLVVNDRVDVALAVDADGVHVGQEDLAAEDARRLLGPDAILGVTVHHAAEAGDGLDLADYAGLGPVFASPSKDNADPPLGVAGLGRLIDELGRKLPVCGIAGVDHGNAASVIGAGADGVAVISDIFMAEDVTAATRRLRRVVDAALDERKRR
jgi:thiamine-phosphate pyrophosphorylase